MKSSLFHVYAFIFATATTANPWDTRIILTDCPDSNKILAINFKQMKNIKLSIIDERERERTLLCKYNVKAIIYYYYF